MSRGEGSANEKRPGVSSEALIVLKGGSAYGRPPAAGATAVRVQPPPMRWAREQG